MDIFILSLHGLKCDASTLATEKKDAKTPQRNVFVPDKRQMRMDMLCDNDLKTVCVFPISTADMMRPELAELYTKCLSISTTFYNGKDEDGKLVEQGSVRLYTVPPRYNAVVGRHLLRPPYKRGALWDPVDLFDIVIPRQRYPGTQRERPRLRLEVELV